MPAMRKRASHEPLAHHDWRGAWLDAARGGAAMLVDGRLHGTIGGGTLEWQALPKRSG